VKIQNGTLFEEVITQAAVFKILSLIFKDIRYFDHIS